MKKNQLNKFMAAALLAGAPLLWSACTDTWNEHYDNVPGGMADQPSLLQNIASDPNLSNFYNTIQAIGGADLLASAQELTVFAPKSLTKSQSDSIIAVYNNDKNQGMKWEDNKAVTQFMQNHIALYNRPISSLTNDTIAMLNEKYMNIVGASNTKGTINGRAFNELVLSNNGYLYKLENMLPFFSNVREFTEHQENMKGLTAFFKQYDEYELLEEQSTPGGVVDGKVVYLDSVTTLYNRIIDRYGEIMREDSVFTMIAPTDEVWDREYERYSKFFVYNASVNNADSLSEVNAKHSIMRGRFFNTSKNWRYNLHPEDSLCNSYYSERQEHFPRTNVYYNPQQGILAGLQKHECSNGWVYVDNKGVIDPKTTFFDRRDMDASSAFYYEIPKDKNNNPTMSVSTNTYEVYKNDSVYNTDENGDTTSVVVINNLKKRYNYVEVKANTATAHSEIEYKIPNTYSNVYYNVYVVSAPARRNAVQIPTWFQIQQSVQNEKGVYGSKSYFLNPHAITADSDVENADVILKQGNNNRCFVARPEKLDTILVQTAVKYDYCGSGVDNGVVKFTISSFGPSGSSYREKIYTRTLRLNQIILVPFETKEEAEAAADDLDAFNDEKLEALRPKK